MTIEELKRLHGEMTAGVWTEDGAYVFCPDPDGELDKLIDDRYMDDANRRGIVALHNLLPALLEWMEEMRRAMLAALERWPVDSGCVIPACDCPSCKLAVAIANYDKPLEVKP